MTGFADPFLIFLQADENESQMRQRVRKMSETFAKDHVQHFVRRVEEGGDIQMQERGFEERFHGSVGSHEGCKATV